MKGELVHFDIPADDPEKLASFYSNVMGWRIEAPQAEYGDYRLISMPGEGIGGGLYKRTEPQQTPLNYFDVENIEAAVQSVTDNGGTVIVEKMPVPKMGYFALCLDPDGNAFGFWLTDENAA
ncbi:MAG: VOC family protein [Candidatus Geothermincolia bacterium]